MRQFVKNGNKIEELGASSFTIRELVADGSIDLANYYTKPETEELVGSKIESAMDVADFANKIVQVSSGTQTMWDYFHEPVPTIIELPAGTVHTVSLTPADIQELAQYYDGTPTRDFPFALTFQSVSGDFQVNVRCTSSGDDTVCEVLLYQKLPGGSFQESALYIGNDDGSGTFFNGDIPQVDWLTFANYDMSFSIRGTTLTPTTVRELNLWKRIQRSILSETVKDLSDVRSDILGELVSTYNTVSNGLSTKANKIIQNSQITQTLFDYLHQPVPTIMNLPLGVTHTHALTAAMIMEVRSHNVIQPKADAYPFIEFSSPAGDFKIQYELSPGGRNQPYNVEVRVIQRSPNGDEVKTIWVSGNVDNPIFHDIPVSQIDWITFTNYQSAITQWPGDWWNTTPESIRELTFWQGISRSHTDSSVKDLSDVRDDILGEQNAMRIRLDNKDAELESKITEFREITSGQLSAMRSDPSLAESSVLYLVNNGTEYDMYRLVTTGSGDPYILSLGITAERVATLIQNGGGGSAGGVTVDGVSAGSDGNIELNAVTRTTETNRVYGTDENGQDKLWDMNDYFTKGEVETEVQEAIQAALNAMPRVRVYQNGEWKTDITDIYIGAQGGEPADLAADALKLYYEP